MLLSAGREALFDWNARADDDTSDMTLECMLRFESKSEFD